MKTQERLLSALIKSKDLLFVPMVLDDRPMLSFLTGFGNPSWMSSTLR